MKLILWLVLPGAGVAAMVVSHIESLPIKPPSPFWTGALFSPKTTDVEVPGDIQGRESKVVVMRQLPVGQITESILSGISESDPARADNLRYQLSEKIFEWPTGLGITQDHLISGRMPRSKTEILAGAFADHNGVIDIGRSQVIVVGRLNPGIAMFSHGYLANRSAGEDIFDPKSPEVRTGILVPIRTEEFHDNLGPGLFARYRQAVMLNLKGSLLVAIVLLIAAIYEAAEVISMMK